MLALQQQRHASPASAASWRRWRQRAQRRRPIVACTGFRPATDLGLIQTSIRTFKHAFEPVSNPARTFALAAAPGLQPAPAGDPGL